MADFKRIISTFSCVFLSLAACSERLDIIRDVYPYEDNGKTSSINENYINGSLVDIKNVRVPTLGEISNLHRGTDTRLSEKDEKRMASLKEVAIEYGLQSGLYFAGKYMDERLNQRASELSNIYNFRSLLIHEPHSGQTFMPPIIVQSSHLYETDDSGEHIKIADKAYTIIQNATPTQNPPSWTDYLLSTYTIPTRPDEKALPHSLREQEVWKRAVTEGFFKGIQQAKDELRLSARRLGRDFSGMTRYFIAYQNGEVKPIVINEQNMGIVGTSKHVRYGERDFSIVEQASLNFSHPENIRATASKTTPTGSIKDRALKLENMSGVKDKVLSSSSTDIPQRSEYFKGQGIDFEAGVPSNLEINFSDPSIGRFGTLSH